MKKFFTHCLLLVTALMLSLATMAQKSVLDENFENNQLPSNWSVAGSFWKFQNEEAVFEALIENGVDTLFTPWISLSELDNQPSVAITYRNIPNAAKVNTLKVLYRASANDTWSTLTEFTAEAPAGTNAKIAFPSSMASVQIALAGAYLGGTATAIQHLSVENKTEAVLPTGLRYEDLTTTGVTLYFDPCLSAKFVQYNLKVNTTPITDFTLRGDVLDAVGMGYTDDFIELSELTPNTVYYFYVQYDCGDGDVSPWASLDFQTPCPAITAPYFDDFENGLNPCASVQDDATATGWLTTISTEYPYNSQHALRFANNKGFFSYYFLPALDDAVKNYQLTFMAATPEASLDYARDITIGVATAQNKENFVELKTISLPLGRKWEKITVSLAGYPGSGKYIALRTGSADGKNMIYVDNLSVEPQSACPMPMFVTITEITAQSAKINWVEAGAANEWNLVLSTKQLADPEDIEPNAEKGEYAGSISANPYTAVNLQPNTTYYVYLQSACGSGEWTNAVSFKTGKPVKFPYFEAFDRFDPEFYEQTIALPEGWVGADRGNNNQSGNTYYDKANTSRDYWPRISKSQDHSNSAYVPAALELKGTSVSSATSTGYTSYAMMPALPVDNLEDMAVTFWAYSTNGAIDVIVGVAKQQATDLPTGQQLTPGTNITELGSFHIATSKEWTEVVIPLNAYQASYGKFITFYTKPGTGTPDVFIDDISINVAPKCFAVTGLTAEATGVKSFRASWTETLDATSWNVKVSSTELANPAADVADIYTGTVSAQEFTCNTSLEMGTTYYIYVTPACGDAWTGTTVTTLSGVEVPYFTDFAVDGVKYKTGAVVNRGPANWTVGYTYSDTWTTSTYVPYCMATAMKNLPAGVTAPYLYLNNTTSASYQFPYAIMPELLNADVKDVVLNFIGYYNSTSTGTTYAVAADKSYYGVLKIGVVNSPADINKTDKFTKVTPVAAVRCHGAQIPEMMRVDMSSYTGSGKYIVFYLDSAKSNYMGIDNLTITLATAPQQVTDVIANNISQTGADMTWTENGSATKWNVRVFSAAVADPDDADSVKVAEYLNVTTTSQTLAGLNHSTPYYVYVQSVQDNGIGMWSAPALFYTECGAWPVPFVEPFDEYATGGASNNTLHPCYDLSASTASNFPYVNLYTGSSISVNHTTGTKSGNIFKMTVSSSKKVAQLNLPAMDKPVNKLQMTVYATNYSSTSYIGDGSTTSVGVVTSDGVFHKVREFKLTKEKVWEEWFVDFSSYEGEDGVIAFRQEYDEVLKKTVYVFLDDILVEEIPQCKKVQDVVAENVDSTSATIKWPAAGVETKWNVKVSTTALDDPDAVTADIFDGAVETAPQKQLTDIPDGTDFFVYVQTVREDQDCTGDWSNVFTFTTKCKAMALPFIEDFTSYEAANIILPCSYVSGDDPTYSSASTSTTTTFINSVGKKTVYRLYSAKDKSNYWALPLMSIDSVKRLTLTLDITASTSTLTSYTAIWHYFEVGVMTDPENPSTFVTLYSDSLNGLQASPTWVERSYNMKDYGGDERGNFGKYIAIHPTACRQTLKSNGNISNTGVYLYLNNIVIEETPACAAPKGVTAEEFDYDTARLSWNGPAGCSSYDVMVYTSADAVPGVDTPVATATSTTTSAVVNGLVGNTVYYAFVRANCTAESSSAWSKPGSWRSACEPLQALPYEESFEGQVANEVPYCWNQITDSYVPSGAPSSSSTTVKATVSTSYKKSGSASLCITYGGGKSAKSITPALNVTSLKNVLIYFDAYSTADATVLIEAVESDGVDVPAISLLSVDVPKSTWTFHTIDLADYYTSAQPYKYLRFSAGAETVYLDNVGFTTDKNKYFPVTALTAQSIGDTWVAYSFEEPTELTEWIVEYGVKGFTLGEGTQKTIQQTTDTITGLNTNTEYDIYVKGNTAAATFVGPLSMATCGAPAAVPYVSDFADGDAWTLINAINGKDYANVWAIDSAALCGATPTWALMIQHDSAYKYITKYPNGDIGTSYAWAYRVLNFSEVATYKVNIKAKSQGAKEGNQSDALYAGLVPAGATFKANTYSRIDGTSGSTSLASNAAYNEVNLINKLIDNPDWAWYETTVDIKTPGLYYLVFKWYNSATYTPGDPAAVDSIRVEEYLCSEVTDLEMTSLNDETASFKWNAGKCQNFQVIVSRYKGSPRPEEMDAEDKLVDTQITGRSYAINNLLPATNYAFYVRTICEEGKYSEWKEYDFLTNCMLESAPYTETFIEIPGCWQVGNATVSTLQYYDPATQTSAQAEKITVLKTVANGLVILPEFDVPVNKLTVSFGLVNGSSLSTITWGVMDNNYDPSTFKQVKIINTVNKAESTGTYTANKYEKYSFMLNLIKAEGRFLAFKTDVVTSIDYITITELPDCITPQQVEITSITENSATINWLAGSEESWSVQVGNAVVDVTENPYVLTGLQQGTTYTVAVRANCDEEHFSEWSQPATFTTECGVHDMPLYENLSEFVPGSSSLNYVRIKPTCWEQMLTSKTVKQITEMSNASGEFETVSSMISDNYAWTMPPQSVLNNTVFNGQKQIISNTVQSISSLATQSKWLITAAYAITGQATFSFDLAFSKLSNKLKNTCAPENNVTLSVVITTDNGVTWQTIGQYPLADKDTVLTTKTIDLTAFAGKNVKIAFTHLCSYSTSLNYGYVRLTNIGLNCVDTYNVADDACAEFDYEGNGFKIDKEEFAAVGESKQFKRFAKAGDEGCDSTVVLTLTTHQAEVDTVYASICRGNSFVFGPYTLTEPNPAGTPYFITGSTVYGCDSTIYLYLSVGDADTTDIPVSVDEGSLPYKVDEFYTVPAGTPVGSFVEVVSTDADNCKYNRYNVTVKSTPTGLAAISDAIERIDIYDCTGRLIRTVTSANELNNMTVPAGVYLLRGKTIAGEVIVDRIVVE